MIDLLIYLVIALSIAMMVVPLYRLHKTGYRSAKHLDERVCIILIWVKVVDGGDGCYAARGVVGEVNEWVDNERYEALRFLRKYEGLPPREAVMLVQDEGGVMYGLGPGCVVRSVVPKVQDYFEPEFSNSTR